MFYILSGALVGMVLASIWLRRIQFHSFTWAEGWMLGIGFCPKSMRIAGVQYMVLSIFLGPLEIRWFCWRWGNAVSS